MARLGRFSKSQNPFLKEDALKKSAVQSHSLEGSIEGVNKIPMTVQGAINKTFILLGIMMMTTMLNYVYANTVLMWGGAIAGLIVVIVAVYKKEQSAILAPIYAGLEGLFVGGISAMYAYMFEGIVLHAVSLTAAILFAMLFIYKSGIIKVTNKFRTGVMMATGGVLIVYLLSFVLSFFGINLPFLHEGGPIGILISLAIIGIASLNLLLDFDNFEKGEQYKAPNYMEWFAAMGLIITLVWIYIEVLRLLAMLSGRD